MTCSWVGDDAILGRVRTRNRERKKARKDREAGSGSKLGDDASGRGNSCRLRPLPHSVSATAYSPVLALSSFRDFASSVSDLRLPLWLVFEIRPQSADDGARDLLAIGRVLEGERCLAVADVTGFDQHRWRAGVPQHVEAALVAAVVRADAAVGGAGGSYQRLLDATCELPARPAAGMEVGGGARPAGPVVHGV